MSLHSDLVSNLPTGMTLEALRTSVPEQLWQESPELGAMLGLMAMDFDYQDYLDRYPDVVSARMDPIQHFALHGLKEGRNGRLKTKTEESRECLSDENTEYIKLFGLHPRLNISELTKKLLKYDIISFDIFDTAILRRVEQPIDIFRILGRYQEWRDFCSLRRDLERDARNDMLKNNGHTEVTLTDIYDMLSKYCNIDSEIMKMEIDLEIRAATPNPYIQAVYQNLIKNGKRIIFCTDMYLERGIIEDLLIRNGYAAYEKLFISNEIKFHKGNSSLQKYVKKVFPVERIIHIGDNKINDIVQSERVGINALWNKDCRIDTNPTHYNNLSGSFYKAIVGNHLNNGIKAGSIYYTHGFQVGGILTSGYCNFLNRTAIDKKADKILFCGRDCYIIHKAYDKYFKSISNSYIETSRNALMMLNLEYYVNYLIWGHIFKYWDAHACDLTISQLLENTGYAFLIPELDGADINPFMFCCDLDKHQFRKFFMEMMPLIKQNSENSIKAARRYYEAALGGSSRIIIADVGWSGTCAEALELFIRREINPDISVTGTVICAGDTAEIAANVISGKLVPYVSGPGVNVDLHEFMHPVGMSQQETDKRHMGLEYLFTATDASLSGFAMSENGESLLLRASNSPENPEQILDMQRGILDFCEKYSSSMRDFGVVETISPYTAFMPLKTRISDEKYMRKIYGDFWYDACTINKNADYAKFETLFKRETDSLTSSTSKHGSILLVSPELKYTGALYALLNMATVLKDLGLSVTVLSAYEGSFRKEFIKTGVEVIVCPYERLANKDNTKFIKAFSFCICNTIETSYYYDHISKLIPSIWFIHEATNIPDFIRGHPHRFHLLHSCQNLYCVSKYAEEALKPYASSKVYTIHNTVSDVYTGVRNDACAARTRIKFCQLGTMERRKGYDILLKAFQALPDNYKDRAELHFAGRFILNEAPFCEWLFNEIARESHVKYHGIIDDSGEKFAFISDMDVVVIASRDESCSLVALEGAMLAKPLIVTENVGAKYLVNDSNGIIVKTANVSELATAMMFMIDNASALYEMGQKSRELYEEKASYSHFRKEVEDMLQRECPSLLERGARNDFDAVISLTSYPKRMKTLHLCLESLLRQQGCRILVELWLSEQDFPFHDAELPQDVLALKERGLVIHWVKDNLKSHKKYFYSMPLHPDLPVITVDDDAIYEQDMALKLLEAYSSQPHCIPCHRANMMLFNREGNLRKYQSWPQDFAGLIDQPSMRLVPIGSGGVLYPPGAVPVMAFDAEIVRELCLDGDDLWLKFTTLVNGYPAVVVKDRCSLNLIEGTQDDALWHKNIELQGNDRYIENIVFFLKSKDERFMKKMEEAKGDF